VAFMEHNLLQVIKKFRQQQYPILVHTGECHIAFEANNPDIKSYHTRI
jgi:hypothetical protein